MTAPQEGFTDDEVEAARTYLLGREPFRRETARQWAYRLAEAAFWGVPMDDPAWRGSQLEGLDRERVEAALRRWIRVEELKVTVGT